MLHDTQLVRGTYEPIFNIASKIPDRKKPGQKVEGEPTRDPLLRRLELDVLEDYIFIEHPSTLITGQYARVIATLQDDRYPKGMLDLALRIANEGGDHERTFIDMKRVLTDYAAKEYLRDLKMGLVGDRQVTDAKAIVDEIVDHLTTAYKHHGDFSRVGPAIAKARMAMNNLLDLGDSLAATGIGIPFFDIWPTRAHV
jgi:hypothetical protein